MARVVTFLGTRPELIKLSPLIPLLTHRFEHVLVHSGQHYTRELHSVFFEELELPPADVNLKVGSDTGARQIGRMMLGLEEVLRDRQPDVLIVLGGTNTALAGALTAAKCDVHIAHLEAGVRTFNRNAPEEINRMLIDRLATWLFAPDETARDHLRAEGIYHANIHTVGSTAIDACRRCLDLAAARPTIARLKLVSRQYLVLTLHRAENTAPETLDEIVAAVNALARIWPIVFPIHPRTLKQLSNSQSLNESVKVINPLGYLDMLNLVQHARALLTDSSSLQEEAAVLGTPALVMRNETEWSYLVEVGANALVGNTYRSLMDRAWPIIASDSALDGMRQRAAALPGGAAQRIVHILQRELNAARTSTPGDPVDRIDPFIYAARSLPS